MNEIILKLTPNKAIELIGVVFDQETNISDEFLEGIDIEKILFNLKPCCKFCWEYSENNCGGYYHIDGCAGRPTTPDNSCMRFHNETLKDYFDRQGEKYDARIIKEAEQ